MPPVSGVAQTLLHRRKAWLRRRGACVHRALTFATAGLLRLAAKPL